jgi:Methyltransferase domain
MSKISPLLRGMADGYDPGSFSNRMRERRFKLFEELTATLPRPLRILDIGGTNAFWEQRGWAGRDDAEITLVNLKAEPRRHPNIHPTVGDATNLDHGDGSFDIAFSNSVIEHLFELEAQQAMAREVQRVARAFWVQTPNFWFPMEPHFLVPGWHWMPETARIALIRRRACGWRGPCPDPEDAARTVREIRLLTRRQLRLMFPGATVHAERIGGAPKSFVVYGGFPATEADHARDTGHRLPRAA